jgi:hypothetical protein
LIAAILEPALRRLRAQRRGQRPAGVEVEETASSLVSRNQLTLALPGVELPPADVADARLELAGLDVPTRDAPGHTTV